MIENFGNKLNTNGLDKNKQNINRKGQPRKLFSTVNAELKAKGIEVLTKEQLIEAYGLIFNTDEEELLRIGKDKQYPYSLRLIIMSMSDKKTRDRAMADYRDYMFGKAIQKEEKRLVDEDGKDVKPTINIINQNIPEIKE